MPEKSSVFFIHLTDVHISERGDSWGALGSQAPHFLEKGFKRFNAMDDLDFVLITGDVLDMATAIELEKFQEAVAMLKKPWYFVPGNHDGFIDEKHPNSYTPEQIMKGISPQLERDNPIAGTAYWSHTVKPGIQLIGLDSRIADHWGGIIPEEQLAWLGEELDSHKNDLVLLNLHHPLHKLGEHNDWPWWKFFICQNADEVNALLDQYPNIRLVFAGHHHANNIRKLNGRLHVNTAAYSGYPCVYRTVHMKQESGGWRTEIETHGIADEERKSRAHDLLKYADLTEWYDEDDLLSFVRFCAGTPDDNTFSGLLP